MDMEMNPDKIYKSLLNKKVSLINECLLNIRFRDREIQDMYSYAIKGGRRFRPLLVVLACEAVGGKKRDVTHIAAAFELGHKASLIHDDLIDGDNFRRGKEAFHSRYTKEKAVIMGDLLISLALDAIDRSRSNIGDRFNICYQVFLDTFRNVVSGEMLEEMLRSSDATNSDIDRMHYKKTAYFTESCFKIGAIAGRATPREIQKLAAFGRYIGLIFQGLNDINNINGLDASVGKIKYLDLLQTRKNHIIVHSLHGSNKLELSEILKKKKPTNKDIRRILQIIRLDKSVEYADKRIDEYIYKARKILSDLKFSSVRIILNKALDHVKDDFYWKS